MVKAMAAFPENLGLIPSTQVAVGITLCKTPVPGFLLLSFDLSGPQAHIWYKIQEIMLSKKSVLKDIIIHIYNPNTQEAKTEV